MDPNKTTLHDYAIFILIFQLSAWFFAISSAGTGMELVYIGAPCIFFIFCSNFFLAFKKKLSKCHRIFSIFNVLGIIIFFFIVNW